MAEDMREKALDIALRVAEQCRCRQHCDTLTDDVLRDAEKILHWLQGDTPSSLVFIVGPVTEQKR